MTPTTYDQWVADARPWRPAPVIDRFAELMRGHGFEVFTIGDQNHLTATLPEDHTPYSHTPWPGAQPYPQILALDVMPGGAVDWRELGYRIVADRLAGVRGTGWIKYINWTDPAGSCWHDRWEPDHTSSPSADRGHIHVSARTDRLAAGELGDWDPVAELLGAKPTPQPQGDPMLTHWTTLVRGSTGDAVRVAQGLLLARRLPVGSASGQPDGDFGPTTEQSTRVLQQRAGIAVDGQFGPHTLSVALYGQDLA
jgi:hypothetical protein